MPNIFGGPPIASRVHGHGSALPNVTSRVQAAARRQATPMQQPAPQPSSTSRAHSVGHLSVNGTQPQAAPSSQQAVPPAPVVQKPVASVASTTLGIKNLHLQSSRATAPAPDIVQQQPRSVSTTSTVAQHQGSSVSRRRQLISFSNMSSLGAQRIHTMPETSKLAENLRQQALVVKSDNEVTAQQSAQPRPSLKGKEIERATVNSQPQQRPAAASRTAVNLPAGGTRSLIPGGTAGPPHSWSKQSLMKNAGVPVLPNPPCSVRRPDVWPFEYQHISTYEMGKVRTMVWPCQCQARLANGSVCAGTHPTKLHGKADLYLEIWFPKRLPRVEGRSFRCTLCPQMSHGKPTVFHHDTEDHSKGMWRVLPHCPILDLDDDLHKFVVLVPEFLPWRAFHPYLYRPQLFDQPHPRHKWPSLPADLSHLEVGYWHSTPRGYNGVADFEWSCARSREILKIPAPVTTTVPQQAFQQPTRTPARIGWSSFVRGHPDLSPPDYKSGHHEWFNESFVYDMDKCIDAEERERLEYLKGKWMDLLRLVEHGVVSDELKSKMKVHVAAAWEIYRHLYPYWTPGKDWAPPIKLKDWRNSHRALGAAKQNEKDKVLSTVVLNFADLDDTLEFEPLEDPELEFKEWAIDDDDDDDGFCNEDVVFSGKPRTHPQLAPKSSQDAKHHLELWLSDSEKFLCSYDSYHAWVNARKVEGRSQLAPLFSSQIVSTAQGEILLDLQDNVFEELEVKVDSLVIELKSQVETARRNTSDSILSTCRKITEYMRAISHEYEASWKAQLSRYLSKGTPQSLLEYYKSFTANGFEGIHDVYMGLLGAYMPFESRCQTVMPRFRWPKAFLEACSGDVEEVVTTTLEVQQEESPQAKAEEEQSKLLKDDEPEEPVTAEK